MEAESGPMTESVARADRGRVENGTRTFPTQTADHIATTRGSELAKLAAIFFVAWWYERFAPRTREFWFGFVFPMAIVSVLLVLIVGEPGLGKSRLIEEFHSKLSETPHTWIAWSFSQLLQNIPLHPVTESGRQRFGGADIPADQRLADLEGALRLVGLDPTEYAPLLAPVMDIPLPPARAPSFPPEELRRRQLALQETLHHIQWRDGRRLHIL